MVQYERNLQQIHLSSSVCTHDIDNVCIFVFMLVCVCIVIIGCAVYTRGRRSIFGPEAVTSVLEEAATKGNQAKWHQSQIAIFLIIKHYSFDIKYVALKCQWIGLQGIGPHKAV